MRGSLGRKGSSVADSRLTQLQGQALPRSHCMQALQSIRTLHSIRCTEVLPPLPSSAHRSPLDAIGGTSLSPCGPPDTYAGCFMKQLSHTHASLST